MITRFAKLTSRLAFLSAFLFTLAACGGGGGGGGGGFIPDDGSDSVTFFLALELVDADGNPTNTITTTRPATLNVTVSRDRNQNNLVTGEIVNATANLAGVTPDSGGALTNEEGVATFLLEAGGSNGADTVTVSITTSEGSAEATLNFQVGLAGLRLGSFVDGTFIEGQLLVEPDEPLSPTGSGTITVAVADEDGNRAETAEQVTISSECLISGRATLDPESPLSVTGQTTVTYTATGCEGEDLVTARLQDSGNEAIGTVSIAPLTANAISFDSAVPDLIVLRGTGGGTGRQESSTVTFNVVDSDNNPVSGIDVSFELSTEVGGLSLGNTSDVSNSQGQVSTTVFSGTVATAVRVFARLVGSELSTTSDVLVVSSGLPDQNSISLSVEGGFVVENGFTVDGTTRQINVRMADKFNNPVPDGTSAVFTTEYGAIQGSCVLTNGACSVTWTAQEPRFPTINGDAIKTIFDNDYDCPSHSANAGPCPDDLGGIRGGRSTVLVAAVGEESFVDQNGNGQYDEGEPFVNLPEAFIDHNEDGVFTPAVGPNCPNPPTSTADCEAAGFEESFIDLNSNGMYDTNDDPAIYNGTQCPPEGEGVFCSRELDSVRAQTVLILSDSPRWDIVLARLSGAAINENGTVSENGGPYNVFVSDLYNNRPPAGSTITVESTGDCEATISTGSVANTSAPGAFTTQLQISGEPADPNSPLGSGSVTVTLNPESGAPYSELYDCTVSNNSNPNLGGLTTGG